jgi:subtilase family protein/flagellar hook capping protein FlgD
MSLVSHLLIGSSGRTTRGVPRGRRHHILLQAASSLLLLAAPVAAATRAPAGALIQEARRGTLPVESRSEGASVLLGNGFRFDPLKQSQPAIAPHMRARALAAGETGSFLVQLAGPVQAGERERIEGAGGRVFAYLPQYTFLVRANAAARAEIASLSFVRWVGDWHPAYKLSGRPEMQAGSGPQTIVLLLFPEAELAATTALLQGMGGAIVEATDSGRNKIIRATVDRARLAEIAARNEVAWIEPWYERTFENNLCQWVVQTNVLNNRKVWAQGLDGTGQVLHTSDSGIRTSHNMFRDPAIPITTWGDYPTHRKIIAYKQGTAGRMFGDNSGASYHGTHTAGTVLGDDSFVGAADLRDGHALKAKMYFHDIGDNSTTVFAPTDMNTIYGPAYIGNAGGGARISSNSWGSPVNQYDVQAMTIDQFMWDHPDFLVFFSSGNNAGPGTTGSPGTNKNCASVGATQNGSNSTVKAGFSSEGPTSDGRRHPMIMTPGDGQTPLSGVSSAGGASDGAYANLSGTSMSSPAAAGATALIRQYLTDGWYPTGAPVAANGFTPSAGLLKALAINSTDNDMAGHTIPDFGVGWGRMKLDNALYFPGDGPRMAVVDETDGLVTGEFVDYQIAVTDASVPLKIALCWTDKEGNPSAATQLVNDLDLTVTEPGGLIAYRGNVFAGGESQIGGAQDVVNVEECVRRNAPTLGVWTIRVAGTNTPFGPQHFGLAVTGGVGNVSGVLKLDRLSYGRDDVVQIRVEDTNAASVTVSVSSGFEPTAETVALSGSGGVHTGTIATTAFSASAGDGKISVRNGDLITVRYVDAAPAGTVVRTAAARFEGPVITGVLAQDAAANQLVTWTTDLAARSRVYYGTTPALGQSAALEALVTSHGVTLTGLQPDTDYYFDVEAVDHAGNATRDDNAGNHYRFVSGRGDVLVAIGDESFSNVGLYTTALLERGWRPALLQGGTLTDPPLGNLAAGLRSFQAVWWQVGLEQYPAFGATVRDSLAAYMNGGGRLSVCGHDIAWAMTDPASGYYTPEGNAWLQSTLRLQFVEDPPAWVVNQGVAGDPISGDYTGGVAYAPHRAPGASGDEIASVPGTGTAAYTWVNTDATAGNIGFRWQSGTANGTPGTAVWGGTPSKLVYHGFEWSGLVDAAVRTDVLDKTLIWLIGNDHPDVTVTAPNGGEVVTGNTVSVTWTEAAFGGASIAARSILYSGDGGATWNLVTNSPGASPYSWNVSALPNGTRYRVRVAVTDNGTPGLSGRDASNADFSIARPGGDAQGPVVVPGSIKSNPNPMDNQSSATLFARVSDQDHGGANVTAAEWSWGASPKPAGTGTAMTGAFGTPVVDVQATIPANTVSRGEQKLWVRGRDAANNWGPAASATFVVNGVILVGIEDGEVPLSFALEPNFPNPVRGGHTAFAFALPRSASVELQIYGVRGEKVRTLAAGPRSAGRHVVSWDARDDAGRVVRSGVYFYKLATPGFSATRKMVVLR